MLDGKTKTMHIDSCRLFIIPFDPELLCMLEAKRNTQDNTVQNQNIVFKQYIVIENKGIFFNISGKKREIIKKFQVKLELNLEETNKNDKGKSVSKPSIIIEGMNQENVVSCFEYIIKLKDNAKFKYYNLDKYSRLIKNKFDEIKTQFKSDDIIIRLSSPQNSKKTCLFATSAANDGKITVERFFKYFDFMAVKRNFDENSFNIVKEKLNEIEDQANIKIIALKTGYTFEFIGDSKDIEVADQIIQNILL